LNCIFKVIAKAVDNRLKKLNEIILSRSQKGFQQKRQIHECLINIIETISYSEANKIPGFVLALDMAKAFDMVRHDFMNYVYRFFGVGPYMINILNTISTGRTAAIIRDNGSTSDPFNLGSGFPQGSPPSPDQFNISEQIILLKFELGSSIKKIIPQNHLPMLGPPGPDEIRVPIPVPVQVPVPVPVAGLRIFGSREANGETGKVEAFADDTTPMGKLEQTAIEFITTSLASFAQISGLKCNVEKSQIMIIGLANPHEPAPD
jgi:hypothetical protein